MVLSYLIFRLILLSETPRQKSKLEMIKAMRDMKRRRQSYRAKNVHITRRTPVQVSVVIYGLFIGVTGIARCNKNENGSNCHYCGR